MLTLLLFFLTSHTVPLVPNDTLTPGEVASTNAAKVCVSGYSATVRHTSASLKKKVYAEYGITRHKTGEFEVDHRISLELGGADTLQNLWPESYLTKTFNAHTKDRLEDELHRRVCSEHSMTLQQAQKILMGNWLTAYPKFVK